MVIFAVLVLVNHISLPGYSFKFLSSSVADFLEIYSFSSIRRTDDKSYHKLSGSEVLSLVRSGRKGPFPIFDQLRIYSR